MNLSEEKIYQVIQEVVDPELYISIVDLGLVYKIEIKQKKKVKITMTLTSIGCPLFSLIENDVKNKIQSLGVKEKDIKIELTFDPPWSVDRMTDKAKAILGI